MNYIENIIPLLLYGGLMFYYGMCYQRIRLHSKMKDEYDFQKQNYENINKSLQKYFIDSCEAIYKETRNN